MYFSILSQLYVSNIEVFKEYVIPKKFEDFLPLA